MYSSIILIFLLSYGSQTKSENSAESLRKLSSVNKDFSFTIFNLLCNNSSDNEIVSPISLLSGLSMLYNGANTKTVEELNEFLMFNKNGITETEINDGFKELFNQMNTSNQVRYQLKIANRVIIQKDYEVLESYKNVLKNYFKAELDEIDFSKNIQKTVNLVNDWVKKMTNNKIDKLIESTLDPSTKLLILNALYFKGNWLNPFKSASTVDDNFFNNGVTQTKVKMMSLKTKTWNYTFSEELNSQILEMPYAGNEICFYILLPKDKTGLEQLKSKLNSENLKTALKSMSMNGVNIYLPKFKVEKKYELLSLLRKIPEYENFLDDPDLSRISGQKDLEVSEILHRVVIDVNEDGTEAAAVTGIVISTRMVTFRQNSIEFKADHPFLYMIRDSINGVILFLGQINQLSPDEKAKN